MSLRGKSTSGSVTSFSGAGGLLEALLAFILGTEVTSETLSGSGVSWSGTLANTSIGLGRFIVTYVISGTTYTGQDDGAGNIVGTGISSGTITHSTGGYSITFSSSVTGTPTADYVYGDDGGDWLLKYKRNTRDDDRSSPSEPFGSDCKECIFHNTGISGADDVLLGIREWQYPGGGSYAWDLEGYITYASNQYWNISSDLHGRDDYDATWNHFSQIPILPLIDDTMYYWFYSDRQCIKVVVKVSSNYESCYLGFGDRYGNPSDFPYPLFIKGSAYGNIIYSDTDDEHAYFAEDVDTGATNDYSCLAVGPDNAFAVPVTAQGMRIYPHAEWYDGGTRVLHETPGAQKQILTDPVTGLNKANGYLYWELDQVIHLAGIGVQSEDLFNGPDSIRYRVFQNTFRTTYKDFIGIGESNYTTTTTTTTTTSSTTTTA